MLVESESTNRRYSPGGICFSSASELVDSASTAHSTVLLRALRADSSAHFWMCSDGVGHLSSMFAPHGSPFSRVIWILATTVCV